ncbi:hypothetical protein GCM10023232_19040 [Sphingosinicella ginsenosidimutans]
MRFAPGRPRGSAAAPMPLERTNEMTKSENFRMLATVVAAFFVSGMLMTASTSTGLLA